MQSPHKALQPIMVAASSIAMERQSILQTQNNKILEQYVGKISVLEKQLGLKHTMGAPTMVAASGAAAAAGAVTPQWTPASAPAPVAVAAQAVEVAASGRGVMAGVQIPDVLKVF